jgi:hypothetical protein
MVRMFQNVKHFQELFQHVINIFELGYLTDTEIGVQLSGSRNDIIIPVYWGPNSIPNNDILTLASGV